MEQLHCVIASCDCEQCAPHSWLRHKCRDCKHDIRGIPPVKRVMFRRSLPSIPVRGRHRRNSSDPLVTVSSMFHRDTALSNMFVARTPDLGLILSAYAPNPRVLFSTPSIKRMLGFDSVALQNSDRSFIEIVHPEDHTDFIFNLGKEDELPWISRVFHQGGNPISLEFRSRPIATDQVSDIQKRHLGLLEASDTIICFLLTARPASSAQARLTPLRIGGDSTNSMDADSSTSYLFTPTHRRSRVSVADQSASASTYRRGSIDLTKIYRLAGEQFKERKEREESEAGECFLEEGDEGDEGESSPHGQDGVDAQGGTGGEGGETQDTEKRKASRRTASRSKNKPKEFDPYDDLEAEEAQLLTHGTSPRRGGSRKFVAREDVKVIELPRGGLVVATALGAVQMGIPPETIKDAMAMGITVPSYFVVPKDMFNRKHGINTAEFEFPAYFNFFIKGTRVNLVTTEETAARIRIVFQETLLGPADINMNDDVVPDNPAIKASLPDLKKELAFFARNPTQPDQTMTVDTILNFIYFDNQGIANLGSGVTVAQQGDEYVLREQGLESFRCNCNIKLPVIGAGSNQSMSIKPSPRALESSFQPPPFGITFLGNSHGFDKNGTTTGFVVWINRRGWMVDPPPRSGSMLRLYGIAPVLIEGVIVTHCHADHDAGTFHKILADQRVTVMTTKTIMGSFLRKYSAITGIEQDILKSMFNFRAARVGEAMNIHGATLNFFYSLHSIPCIGFECFYGRKSFVYSADTLNEPERMKQMGKEGVLSKARLDFLLNFPWHHTVVLHEAGIPPIHTPLSTFRGLDARAKARLYLVHCAEDIILKDPSNAKGLKRAKEGVEHTIRIPVHNVPHADAMMFLDLVGRTNLFRNISPIMSSELLQIFSIKSFQPEEVIVPMGDNNGSLYIIVSGVVCCQSPKHTKYLSTGDYFGWKNFASGIPSPFKRFGLNKIRVVVFKKQPLNRVLQGTSVLRVMRKYIQTQASPVWSCIHTNSMLGDFSQNSKIVLGDELNLMSFSVGEVLSVAGSTAKYAVLIHKGTLSVECDESRLTERTDLSERPPSEVGPGAFLCDVRCFLSGAKPVPQVMTVRVTSTVYAYTLSPPQVRDFVSQYPGCLMRLLGSVVTPPVATPPVC